MPSVNTALINLKLLKRPDNIYQLGYYAHSAGMGKGA